MSNTHAVQAVARDAIQAWQVPLIVVKPGEQIPDDGTVTSGSSNVSEADLTGEPVPVGKSQGSLVLSGSVNLDGVLEIRASKRSTESKYTQIVHLVEEAQGQKAPIHRLADRYSVWFTIAAVSLAGLAWALSGDSVYALAVMVCASPCPLILATPIAIMSGIDLAARNGIIAKSGACIEQLGSVDIVVFDKTGTLTLGMPKVTAVVRPEQDRADDEARGSNDDSAIPCNTEGEEKLFTLTLMGLRGKQGQTLQERVESLSRPGAKATDTNPCSMW